MKFVPTKLVDFPLVVPPVGSVISLRPFFLYLKEKAGSDKTAKAQLYQNLIDKIEATPALLKPLKPEKLSRYAAVFELMYAYLTGITTEETELMWGLAPPRPGPFFYGTDQLYGLFFEEMQQIGKTREEVIRERANRQLTFVYAFILERCYDFNPLLENGMFHSIIDRESMLSRYYRIHVDTRFVEISCKIPMPELDLTVVEEHMHNGTLIEYLQGVLPIEQFEFTGFSIVHATEYTAQYAIQTIKNTILNSNRASKDDRMAELVQALRTIAGCKELDFGFIPFIRLNGNLRLDFGALSNSKLLEFHANHNGHDKTVANLLEQFIDHPRPLYHGWSSESFSASPEPIKKILASSGTRVFALLPLRHNDQLTGALEVYTTAEKALDKKLLLKIDTALPLVGQIVHSAVDEFQSVISQTVNDKFTSIQPAVQWRFNVAAWHYLQDCHIEKKEAEPENIVFEQLYPLYGAVDIRNSSVERNKALKDDLCYQLDLLKETFIALQEHFPMFLLDKQIFECENWHSRLTASFTTDETIQLNFFLDREALPMLQHLQRLKPEAGTIVTNYLQALDSETGKAHEHRRNLETSTQLVTRALGNYLEEQEGILQKTYPFYFEKYRTDGVEYDIFIGQSLNPLVPFAPIYLKNLRLWQLESMAYICNMIHDLEDQMPKVLHVTLLIYVNSDPIDIHFRHDEKRFDVDGGYNIRYQMIKKRIDKVYIRDKKERLTQPGKIALVYSNRKDAEEYISHIRYLQHKEVLEDNLEDLDLEELQGVSGLKALRVGVRLQHT
ncbi:MAG: GAF domain-containing protein [Bacteroidetes bacterium]|nr:MAG: GAF domain-containing protein [Bacteroidota bacterium]